MSGDRLEIWLEDGGMVVALDSSHQPATGELINVRKKTYRVIGRTYTIDHADEYGQTQACCIVTVKPETRP